MNRLGGAWRRFDMASMLTAVRSAEPRRSPQEPDPQVPERAHLRRFSASYKQKILSEYEGLGKAGRAPC
jgi:hypothetical protein